MGAKGSKSGAVTYPCTYCKEECVPKSKQTTDFPPKEFRDGFGELHEHDTNTGTVTIKCRKGHKSQHIYLAKCAKCDWTNVGQY